MEARSRTPVTTRCSMKLSRDYEGKASVSQHVTTSGRHHPLGMWLSEV